MRGVKVFPFTSFQQLLDYVVGRKGILVAINAEKILHATHQTRDIINRNIGYCDGVGAVMALRKHGHKDVVKLPGCELWLKIIAALAPQGKRFYLVGSKLRDRTDGDEAGGRIIRESTLWATVTAILKPMRSARL